jgi:hypothetical protein
VQLEARDGIYKEEDTRQLWMIQVVNNDSDKVDALSDISSTKEILQQQLEVAPEEYDDWSWTIMPSCVILSTSTIPILMSCTTGTTSRIYHQ